MQKIFLKKYPKQKKQVPVLIKSQNSKLKTSCEVGQNTTFLSKRGQIQHDFDKSDKEKCTCTEKSQNKLLKISKWHPKTSNLDKNSKRSFLYDRITADKDLGY